MPEYSAEPFAGERLDRALRHILRDSGLRAARRLIVSGQARVNGKPVSPSYKLRRRDVISLTIFQPAPLEPPPLLARQGDYLFYYKRAGLHTVSIAGSCGGSLEGALRSAGSGPPRLLQRLDRDTAGIVLVAASGEACAAYRREELAGHCCKWYLALLSGLLHESRWVKNALNCNGGKSVRVRAEEADHKLWTYFRPLASGENGTLAAVCIGRGQRHQIRAHARHMGHPLRGDALYGDLSPGSFILEHCSLSFPGHHFTYLHPESPLRGIFPLEVELWLKSPERSCM